MSAWKKLLYRVSGRLPCRLIDIEGQPYLERYYLGKCLGATFYLHRFVSGDSERNVHDHPWPWAFSLILSGAYVEERLCHFSPDQGWISRNITRRWWRPNWLTGASFHRITRPEPETWTLFIHGPRRKGWGFLAFVDGVAIYHQPYNVKAFRSWHTTALPGWRSGRAPQEFNRKEIQQ